MIRINQIKLKPNHSEKDLSDEIRKILRLKNEQTEYEVVKQSVDARKKPDIKFIYSVNVHVSGWDNKKEIQYIKKINNNNVMYTENTKYEFPKLLNKDNCLHKIIIVGTGPAGLFCGLMLAKAGLKPLLIERGSCVTERTKKVLRFWNEGILDSECNVQFGEGGAGTFSDGKLNTQIKDTSGRIHAILEMFVSYGAPKEILYSNKPHIGTDILTDVVMRIRNDIISLGGDVRFDTKMTDIIADMSVRGIVVNDNETIPCDTLVLALGHSARDTFEMLYKKGFDIRQKPFAMGVRIEHPQQMIDDFAYGDNIYELPAASYKVTYKTDGRGVYSFCMCPGGYVVNASSEPGHLCVNGMSYSDRGGSNANSAIVVTVTPDDFSGNHPLAGIEFQRNLESRAYAEGCGKIPVQSFESFENGVETCFSSDFKPCTKGDYKISDLHNVLPEFMCKSIIEGIHGFAEQIPGFDRKDAILLGIESRTSSPVKIVRDDESLSCDIGGIYPCGEGAGYAGGITSAAIDGIRVAEAIVNKINIE
ncbi:MAG: NAD(P)/FAD-dependent oxidoreductase [Lachnospiraceae bacterium]